MKKILVSTVKFVGIVILSIISKAINLIEKINYGEVDTNIKPRGIKYEFNFHTQWEREHYQKNNLNYLNGWTENF